MKLPTFKDLVYLIEQKEFSFRRKPDMAKAAADAIGKAQDKTMTKELSECCADFLKVAIDSPSRRVMTAPALLTLIDLAAHVGAHNAIKARKRYERVRWLWIAFEVAYLAMGAVLVGQLLGQYPLF